MTKKMDFLTWDFFDVPKTTCRGCFLNQVTSHEIKRYLDPIYIDEYISVRQDAECAMPAFYIVSINQHIGSLMDIEDDLVCRLWIAAKFIRVGLKELFWINKAQFYQEERLENSHYHIRILPVWQDYILREWGTPKIYDRNVVDYMRSYGFQEYSEKILMCNEKMRSYLQLINLNEKLDSINC